VISEVKKLPETQDEDGAASRFYLFAEGWKGCASEGSKDWDQTHVTLPMRPEDTVLKGTGCITLPANLIFCRLYCTIVLHIHQNKRGVNLCSLYAILFSPTR
jgi:hypothetical protein